MSETVVKIEMTTYVTVKDEYIECLKYFADDVIERYIGMSVSDEIIKPVRKGIEHNFSITDVTIKETNDE